MECANQTDTKITLILPPSFTDSSVCVHVMKINSTAFAGQRQKMGLVLYKKYPQVCQPCFSLLSCRVCNNMQLCFWATAFNQSLSESLTGKNSLQTITNSQIQACFCKEGVPGSPYRMITRLRKTAFIRQCQIAAGDRRLLSNPQQASSLYVHYE